MGEAFNYRTQYRSQLEAREGRRGGWCETVLDNKGAVGSGCGVYEGVWKGGAGWLTSVFGPLPKESDKHQTDWPEASTPFKNCHRRGKEVFEGQLGQLGRHASYSFWKWDVDGGE